MIGVISPIGGVIVSSIVIVRLAGVVSSRVVVIVVTVIVVVVVISSGIIVISVVVERARVIASKVISPTSCGRDFGLIIVGVILSACRIGVRDAGIVTVSWRIVVNGLIVIVCSVISSKVSISTRINHRPIIGGINDGVLIRFGRPASPPATAVGIGAALRSFILVFEVNRINRVVVSFFLLFVGP